MSEIVTILSEIATNTSRKSTMISISSTTPEFSVYFPTVIVANEIALGQLWVYYNWPNIRSKAFNGLQLNNSLAFLNQNKPDGTPDWKDATIPTGSYHIEEINNEFQRRIKSIMEKESKIAITAHKPTLSSAIEILSPGYSVKIYESSIRTVLGWPETAPTYNGTPEPNINEFLTEEKIYIKNPDYLETYPWARSEEFYSVQYELYGRYLHIPREHLRISGNDYRFIKLYEDAIKT